ncbi:MAG: bifunctional aspartate kinase/homoserine dehydrogenase I, partial [Bacteroidales bacterium]
MRVLKFGGTSVGNAESIRAVVEIIAARERPLVAVFSAFSGITNKLNSCLTMASERDSGYHRLLDEAEDRHVSTALKLLRPGNAAEVAAQIRDLKARLSDILNGISNIGEVTTRSSDMVLGFGELMSIRVIYKALSERLGDFALVDAREMIFTRLVNGEERADTETTVKAIREKLSDNPGVIVTSGFISTSVKGYATTLGRGGSDHTASLIAAAMDAELLEVWTDVSGIYTADPAYTEDAHAIAELSYAEALELSHFGAKVIYPPSIHPVMEKRIPVLVKNTFAPSDRGTLITEKASPNGSIIKAISSTDRICLVSLTGSGMAGVVGIASRLFSALAINHINVILITQASSEQSICIAIEELHGERAREVIDDEFEFEIRSGRVRPAIVENGYSIIAMVGEGMKHSVGISGQAFSALGRNGVNIHAIAQGSSELNVSTVVKMSDCRKAVNSIHQEFFRSACKVINLFIVGAGNVGAAFIEQVLTQSGYFEREYKTEFRIIGLANFRKMIISAKGIRGPEWRRQMMESERSTDLQKFTEEMFDLNLPNTIFIDNTSSPAVTGLYQAILERSISIVTCNKIAASSTYDSFTSLKKLAIAKRTHFRFESNVGAGLPVIQTIDNMIKTGDRLIRIEAVLSGSLNFIFNSFCEGMKFSEAVEKAIKGGYTEPDPLIDLRGTDISRKLLILVREAGIRLEASEIELTDYLPHPLPDKVDPGTFNTLLRDYDDFFEMKREGLVERNEKLRIIARYSNGLAGISLDAVGSAHPFYILEGNDNIVSLFSNRYSERPLIIKGAGAGADVTASGIFADILSIIN